MSIKYGINLLLWTDTLADEKLHLLDTVKKLGYDVVELPIFDKNVSTAKRWGKAAEDLGLLRSGCCVCGPDENMISADAAIRRRGIDANKAVLDCCAAAGCSCMVGNSASAIGVFTGNPPSEDEWKWGVDGMREVAEHAENVGVRIALEALNRFEAYFINCAADGADFVRRVDHPFCGMMYDTFHANIEEKSPRKAIQTLKDILFHVHISENDRSTPGKGGVNWKETFDTLHEIEYEGFMVVESFGASLPKLAAATKIWRKMYGSEQELAADAIAFMKREISARKR